MTESSLTEEQLRKAIALTIDNNAPVVRDWLENKPGSWGFLAGKAVMTCRHKVGRRLTDEERRTVWHELWRALTDLSQDSTD